MKSSDQEKEETEKDEKNPQSPKKINIRKIRNIMKRMKISSLLPNTLRRREKRAELVAARTSETISSFAL